MTRTGAHVTGLISRWWLPLSLALGTAGGAAYAWGVDTVYTADAYVVVVAQDDPAQAADFAAAYARVAGHSGLLTHDAAERDSLSVAASPDAPLVRLTSTADSAPAAADRADRAAEALIAYANAHAVDTRVRLASFAGAFASARPSAPVPLVSMAIGACGTALVTGIVRLAVPQARQQARREPALSGARA